MVEKLKQGVYKCRHCGQAVTGHRKAKKHELYCGMENLIGYVDDIETVQNMDIPENETSESHQLKLGENYIQKCPNCDTKITSSDRIRGRRFLFECRKCDNVVRSEH